MKNPAVKYGLIAGFIGVLLSTLTYAMGVAYMANLWTGLLILVIIIVMYVILSIRIRKDAGGFITFKDAFIRIFIMCLIAGVIGAIYNIILNTLIDPELPQKLQVVIIEKTTSMMEKFGAPQEEIDKAIDKLQNEAANKFTVLSQLKGLAIMTIVSAIFALILAAIVKKNPPIVDEPKPNA